MKKKLTIRYIGTNYHGWQVQKNAITVQQTLQDALERATGTRPGVTGCSRTDSGVHANMYCCHFEYDGKLPDDKMTDALNAYLPHDIAALSCEDVPDNFHARYSVRTKEYIYQIHNAKTPDPFLRNYALYVKSPLDIGQMRQAASRFIGTHDFAGFCSAGSSVEDTVRKVIAADVTKSGSLVTFNIEANGFLYNMVRIITGTLLDASYGKILPGDIPEIISSKSRDKAGATAPAHGLFLNRVIY